MDRRVIALSGAFVGLLAIGAFGLMSPEPQDWRPFLGWGLLIGAFWMGAWCLHSITPPLGGFTNQVIALSYWVSAAIFAIMTILALGG